MSYGNGRYSVTQLTSVPQIGESVYRILDLGGQRSERRKWLHYFSDVAALVFLVPLSDYDVLAHEKDLTPVSFAFPLAKING